MSTFVFTQTGMSVTSGYQCMPLSVPESRRAPSWRDPSSCAASRNLESPLQDSDCESPELRWIPPQCMGWPMHGILCGTASHRCGDSSGKRGTKVSLKINISAPINQVCDLFYAWHIRGLASCACWRTKNCLLLSSLTLTTGTLPVRFTECTDIISLNNTGVDFNCYFTVHFDKYKNILPTNALFC